MTWGFSGQEYFRCQRSRRMSMRALQLKLCGASGCRQKWQTPGLDLAC